MSFHKHLFCCCCLYLSAATASQSPFITAFFLMIVFNFVFFFRPRTRLSAQITMNMCNACPAKLKKNEKKRKENTSQQQVRTSIATEFSMFNDCSSNNTEKQHTKQKICCWCYSSCCSGCCCCCFVAISLLRAAMRGVYQLQRSRFVQLRLYCNKSKLDSLLYPQ